MYRSNAASRGFRRFSCRIFGRRKKFTVEAVRDMATQGRNCGFLLNRITV